MGNRPATGFTLIEILVVLFIVSIMSGVVVANLPSMTQSADFDAEVKRLEIVLELAREEALFQSSEFGFRLDKDRRGDLTGYSFTIYDELEQTWVSYDVPPLHPHQLDEGIEMELKVEGDGFSLSDEEEEGSLPPVMLLSSGESTPFELAIFQNFDRIEGKQVVLETDGYNRIQEQRDED